MAAHSFSGGAALRAKLQEIAKQVEQGGTLRVGFLEGARYTDKANTPIAMVAAIQEFGAPRARIPPRPFFRTMIAAQSPTWGATLAKNLKFTGFDAEKALGLLGGEIASELVESIKQTNSPALSPVTLMLRKMYGNHPEEITGKSVSEAARRVAAGKSFAGVSTKPLHWTGQMQNAVSYEVKT